MNDEKNPETNNPQAGSNQASAAKVLEELLGQKAQLQQDLLDQQRAAQNLSQKAKALESEIHHWQHDYEQLRIQKGGFGFKALAAFSFGTLLFGIALGWLFFKQKQPDSIVFDKFNHAAGFSLEYHIAHQEYPAAERLISQYRRDPYYKTILPLLDLLLLLVQAAKTASDSTQNLHR